MKFLITGLGNIGPEYQGTRHNIGFDIVSAFAAQREAEWTTDRLADVTHCKVKGHILTLIKPSTYMNDSGKAVNYWLQKEDIPVENLLVCVDDLSIPFGALRLKGRGSDGGHNGLKSINAHLGTQDYARLRFGLGNNFPRGAQINFVLSPWTEEENEARKGRIETATQIIESYTLQGLERTMTAFNNK